MIGLVGKSGAGKSTTINLLCRFYEADAGSLKVDGVDIKDVSLRDLRRHIGDRAAGAVPVQRDHRREHRLRQAGRDAARR